MIWTVKSRKVEMEGDSDLPEIKGFYMIPIYRLNLRNGRIYLFLKRVPLQTESELPSYAFFEEETIQEWSDDTKLNHDNYYFPILSKKMIGFGDSVYSGYLESLTKYYETYLEQADLNHCQKNLFFVFKEDLIKENIGYIGIFERMWGGKKIFIDGIDQENVRRLFEAYKTKKEYYPSLANNDTEFLQKNLKKTFACEKWYQIEEKKHNFYMIPIYKLNLKTGRIYPFLEEVPIKNEMLEYIRMLDYVQLDFPHIIHDYRWGTLWYLEEGMLFEFKNYYFPVLSRKMIGFGDNIYSGYLESLTKYYETYLEQFSSEFYSVLERFSKVHCQKNLLFCFKEDLIKENLKNLNNEEYPVTELILKGLDIDQVRSTLLSFGPYGVKQNYYPDSSYLMDTLNMEDKDKSIKKQNLRRILKK